MTRVLVTGGRGWIGSAVCAELAEREHTVTVCDIKDGCDILDGRPTPTEMNGFDAVVHLAAIPHPSTARQWEDYYGMNVVGTQMVAATAVDVGVPRLIYSSSTAYYGAQLGWLHGPRPLIEHGPNGIQRNLYQEPPELTPYNQAALAYTCSKIAAEACLAAFAMAGRLEVIVLRFAPSPASGEPWEWGLLCERDRAARAIADAVEKPSPVRFEVYNVASPDVALVDTGRYQEWTDGIY